MESSIKDIKLPRKGGSFTFGTYPQHEVIDEAVRAALNAARPFDDTWTSYGYWRGNRKEDYAFFADVVLNDVKYRGVLFKNFRPIYTFSSSEITYQKDNGYELATPYWFIWEPIEWEVMNVRGGKALMLSKAILDGTHFYNNNYLHYMDGRIVSPNNYCYSDIRKWLNAYFYEQAFDSDQKELMLPTRVTVDPTFSEETDMTADSREYDKVFLLSVADAAVKGLDPRSYGQRLRDAFIIRNATDYAKCLGVINGPARWWLRTPHANDEDSVRVVAHSGSIGDAAFVQNACTGVAPAIMVKGL